MINIRFDVSEALDELSEVNAYLTTEVLNCFIEFRQFLVESWERLIRTGNVVTCSTLYEGTGDIVIRFQLTEGFREFVAALHARNRHFQVEVNN